MKHEAMVGKNINRFVSTNFGWVLSYNTDTNTFKYAEGAPPFKHRMELVFHTTSGASRSGPASTYLNVVIVHIYIYICTYNINHMTI